MFSVFLLGGGYFVSLRSRASFNKPRVSFCEPRKIPAKKSKNGHNALIGYLLHAGCSIMLITEENGTTFSDQTGPTNRNRTLTSFHSFSEFSTQVKRSRAVNRFVKNWTANFGPTGPARRKTTSRGDPVNSGRKKPKGTFTFGFQTKFQESLA